MPKPPVYVVGDVHGQITELSLLLRRAGLMSESLTWTGDNATLWFLGDFTDRGPNGLAAIDLAMWLQRDAEATGGRVDSLLGNHDLLLVAARRFGGAFLNNWRRNGGITSDLKGLKDRHARWLMSRPAMTMVGETLLIHADTASYALRGSTVEAVNAAVAAVMDEGDPVSWNVLLDHLSERHVFDISSAGGSERATSFLSQFGAKRLVHGHTPICYVLGVPPETVVDPLVYADGQCINIDGGLYLGGAGFICEIEPES